MRLQRNGLAAGNRLRRLERNEQGAELIEFALVSLLLLTLLFGIMEFGRAIWIYNTVAHVAREGARFAIVRGAESALPADAAAVNAHVQGLAAGMSGLVVTPPFHG